MHLLLSFILILAFVAPFGECRVNKHDNEILRAIGRFEQLADLQQEGWLAPEKTTEQVTELKQTLITTLSEKLGHTLEFSPDDDVSVLTDSLSRHRGFLARIRAVVNVGRILYLLGVGTAICGGIAFVAAMIWPFLEWLAKVAAKWLYYAIKIFGPLVRAIGRFLYECAKVSRRVGIWLYEHILRHIPDSGYVLMGHGCLLVLTWLATRSPWFPDFLAVIPLGFLTALTLVFGLIYDPDTRKRDQFEPTDALYLCIAWLGTALLTRSPMLGFLAIIFLLAAIGAVLCLGDGFILFGWSPDSNNSAEIAMQVTRGVALVLILLELLVEKSLDEFPWMERMSVLYAGINHAAVFYYCLSYLFSNLFVGSFFYVLMGALAFFGGIGCILVYCVVFFVIHFLTQVLIISNLWDNCRSLQVLLAGLSLVGCGWGLRYWVREYV